MTDRGGGARPEKSSSDDARSAGSSRASRSESDRDFAGVLHDVSNVLTVLLGWVTEAKSETDHAAREQALVLVEQHARMARDLAREAVSGVRKDEKRAVGAIASDVVQSLRLAAAAAGVTLRLTGGDSAVVVAGAADVLQVITNLVMNALAHAPRGSEVQMALSAESAKVVVVVADHGPGVPAERRERIFLGESFREGGTGVGLRHSREAARAAGGDLELLPDTEGGGARFRLTWPRAISAARPSSTGVRAQELAGVAVLVVEDDPAVSQLLETALEARGAAVTLAATSAEFERAVAARAYQVALLDLSPIAADAEGAITGLKRSSPGIDLVLISGSADRLPAAISAAEWKLVRKPFEMSELLAALRKTRT